MTYHQLEKKALALPIEGLPAVLEALFLPEEERLFFSQILERRIVESGLDPEIEELWVAEAERRAEAINKGNLSTRPATDVIAELRRKFG
jgi:hypothetical protein